MANSQDLQKQFKALYDSYAADLPAKVAVIRKEWQQLNNQPSLEAYQRLFQKTHGLAGSGATFGFTSISEIAKQLEEAFRQHQNQATKSFFADDNIDQLLKNLEHAVYAPQEQPDFNTLVKKPKNINAGPVVFLITKHKDFAEDLCQQLNIDGIKTHIFTKRVDLISKIKNEHPVAILMDLTYSQKLEHEIGKTGYLNHNQPFPPELIIISEQDDMESRLCAARLGAKKFILKPVNIPELSKSIWLLFQEKELAPYRILIIDDDTQVAHHSALVLQRAGMETQVLINPMKILEALITFQPELILLDLNMPDCNGTELATVIRQQCSYTGTLIVFFSKDTDIDHHINALHSGGDDFFVKSMTTKQLVSGVEAHVKRARSIQNLMMHDGLTGLYNRTHFDNFLRREYAHSLRNNSVFSFIILDLDHFKKINDQYGHPIGDRVLQSIANLLSDRLRIIDIIGRYGGEEFAILLPDTRADLAAKIIQELADKFQKINFFGNNQPFTATFSAGVAESSNYKDINALIKAADQALYQAKAEGRNQVCISH